MVYKKILSSDMFEVKACTWLQEWLTIGCSSRRFGQHQVHKFCEVYLTVAVNVSLLQHLVHFFFRKLLTQVCHHMLDLRGRDEAIAVPAHGRVVHSCVGYSSDTITTQQAPNCTALHLCAHMLLKGTLPKSSPVEHLECIPQLVINGAALHLSHHEHHKLIEINSAIAILVYLIDHVLNFHV